MGHSSNVGDFVNKSVGISFSPVLGSLALLGGVASHGLRAAVTGAEDVSKDPRSYFQDPSRRGQFAAGAMIAASAGIGAAAGGGLTAGSGTVAGWTAGGTAAVEGSTLAGAGVTGTSVGAAAGVAGTRGAYSAGDNMNEKARRGDSGVSAAPLEQHYVNTSSYSNDLMASQIAAMSAGGTILGGTRRYGGTYGSKTLLGS